QPAERLHGLPDGAPCVGLEPDVTLDGEAPVADDGRRLAYAIAVEVESGRGPALAHEGLGHGPTDPLRRAGDQGDLPGEPLSHRSSSSLSDEAGRPLVFELRDALLGVARPEQLGHLPVLEVE